MSHHTRLLAAAVLVVVLAAACSSSPAPTPSAPSTPRVLTTLTVFAAASLAETMPDLEAAWVRDHPDTHFITSTGSSTALQTQIVQGAPADLFLAADTINPQALINGGQALGHMVRYATNTLAVIVPADNPAAISTPLDLAKLGVCVVAAGDGVPITAYAEQLVANLAALPDYGAAFATGYEANVCSREDDVAAVVSKISLGEGDAAIVYGTDAASGQNLRVVELPADVNVNATYAGVVIKESSDTTTATDFLNWLSSDDAQLVLSAHGFGPQP